MTRQDQTKAQSAGRPGSLESIFPFLPHVFSCQSALPSLDAAEMKLLGAIAAAEGALDPGQRVQLTHAAIRPMAEPGPFDASGVGSTLDPALQRFALKFRHCPTSISHHDIRPLSALGLSGAALVEAVNAVALAHFFLTLAKASEFDFGSGSVDPLKMGLAERSQEGSPGHPQTRPTLGLTDTREQATQGYPDEAPPRVPEHFGAWKHAYI